jgi:hypothetical protein
MSRLVLVAAVVFATPHNISGQASMRATVLFCEMVSHPEIYASKVISTEALVRPLFHSLAFYDPMCLPTEENNVSTQMVLPDSFTSTKFGRELSKLLRRGRAARVRVLGRFDATGGPYGQEGNKFRFVVERIDSAIEVSSKSVR